MAAAHGELIALTQCCRETDQFCSPSPPLSAAYCVHIPLELSLPATSLASFTQSAIGSILLDIKQILYSLPTKDDLQAIFECIADTCHGDLCEVVRERHSSSEEHNSAPMGPQTLPGFPVALVSSEIPCSTTQIPEIADPCSKISSGMPLPQAVRWEVIWETVPHKLDTAAHLQALQILQASDQGLSHSAGLYILLPVLSSAALWRQDIYKPILLKLREAGALYRWGCFLLYLMGLGAPCARTPGLQHPIYLPLLGLSPDLGQFNLLSA